MQAKEYYILINAGHAFDSEFGGNTYHYVGRVISRHLTLAAAVKAQDKLWCDHERIAFDQPFKTDIVKLHFFPHPCEAVPEYYAGANQFRFDVKSVLGTKEHLDTIEQLIELKGVGK